MRLSAEGNYVDYANSLLSSISSHSLPLLFVFRKMPQQFLMDEDLKSYVVEGGQKLLLQDWTQEDV